MPADGPFDLSVILPADRFETIREILASLGEQEGRDRIEIVIAVPSAEQLTLPDDVRDGFGAVRVVEVGEQAFAHLHEARAAAVQAVSAPIVLFGETHCFPEPGWLDALLEAHRGPWAAVGPAMVNGNPKSAISWSSFLLDYGPWIERGEPGPRSRIPGHNGAFKREALTEYGAGLTDMMISDTLLTDDLVRRGQQLYFAPAARTRHVNVSEPRAWIAERFAAGREFASARSLEWSRSRRLAFAAASPLIPLVRLYRVTGDVRRIGRAPGLGLRIVPALLVSLVISAAGEFLGYLRGSSERAVERLTEIEIHRLRYAKGSR